MAEGAMRRPIKIETTPRYAKAQGEGEEKEERKRRKRSMPNELHQLIRT